MSDDKIVSTTRPFNGGAVWVIVSYTFNGGAVWVIVSYTPVRFSQVVVSSFVGGQNIPLT